MCYSQIAQSIVGILLIMNIIYLLQCILKYEFWDILHKNTIIIYEEMAIEYDSW